MMKLVLAAAVSSFAFAAVAQADEMKACDDATFKMVMTDVEAATDAPADRKAMAMKELDMAKMAMADKKMEECSMHLGMAAEAVMKK
ncbi:MAG: hypothetical protein WCC57_15590 [Paracoccaceae bacterium]